MCNLNRLTSRARPWVSLVAPALVSLSSTAAALFFLGLAAPAVQAAKIATGRGSKEMIFRFSGLSSLGLSGYTEGLGLRYYLKDGLALRPGFDFGWSRKRTHPAPVPPDQPKPSNELEINTLVQLELALERHLAGPPSVSPYLGCGVFGRHYDYKTEPSLAPDAPIGTLSKITERGTDAAVFGTLGFEWGWTESLTLGAETRFGLTVTTGKIETEAVQTPDRLSHDVAKFDVGFQTVSLLLSVQW